MESFFKNEGMSISLQGKPNGVVAERAYRFASNGAGKFFGNGSYFLTGRGYSSMRDSQRRVSEQGQQERVGNIRDAFVEIVHK
ncbi:hypothetical protein AWR27_24190 [Spirosoma montaniterrae]|uniref:Uncharacterized protein n=1 Tax=Spirosoma montaniterrae TaxID=1178516 RepID=A0A1P9X3B3_9BACT|nr:hypothetical protein AWR27_24190 [Spirosoma montaniterrae]